MNFAISWNAPFNPNISGSQAKELKNHIVGRVGYGTPFPDPPPPKKQGSMDTRRRMLRSQYGAFTGDSRGMPIESFFCTLPSFFRRFPSPQNSTFANPSLRNGVLMVRTYPAGA
uniref:Uncharacterized protein n=1 Tax=Eutreptiella gymnastica TaxID=73025 RepID=A0A7S1IG58_9EUGL